MSVPGGVRGAACLRDRPARGSRGGVDRRHHRIVPRQGRPPRDAAADVGRGRHRGADLPPHRRGAAGARSQPASGAARAAGDGDRTGGRRGGDLHGGLDATARRRAARRSRGSRVRGIGARVGQGARRDGLLRRHSRGPRDRCVPRGGIPAVRASGADRKRPSSASSSQSRSASASTGAESASTSLASFASRVWCSSSSRPDCSCQRSIRVTRPAG